MPANLVFRRKISGARDNGIPPRSTPGNSHLIVVKWSILFQLALIIWSLSLKCTVETINPVSTVPEQDMPT